VNEVSEWFPVFTERISLATVQGLEWLLGEATLHQTYYIHLQDCATQNLDCFDDLTDEYQIAYDYIYLRKIVNYLSNSFDCCYPVRNTIEDSADFELVFDGSGATIFVNQ
jgi:hypothetical protein